MRSRALGGMLMLGWLAASCAERAQPGRASSTAAVATTRTPAPAGPLQVSPGADVAVEMRAPPRARYDATAPDAAKPVLGIVVTNRGARPLDVGDLRVYLDAMPAGVSFHCARVVGATTAGREPAVLAPGASYVFERALDCALPLVGAYAVRVGVSFGKGDWSVPREVRAFSLTVTALPAVAPRELDDLPGLWASLGSSATLPGDTSGGHGRTVLALLNGSRAPIEPPRMRLALRVYKVGSPIPCEDEPLVLAMPDVLEPGQTHYEPIEISCVGLSAPGTYEIAARLLVSRGSEGDREIPIGRLRVEVLAVPMLSSPMPR